jgi:hypothetical protein
LSRAYPTIENMEMLVQIAHQEAYTLAINAAIPNKETIKDLIREAYTEMLSLSSSLPSLEEKAASSEEVEKG